MEDVDWTTRFTYLYVESFYIGTLSAWGTRKKNTRLKHTTSPR